MNEAEVLKVLHKTGAVITDSHIVYVSGKHGSAYVNKDAVYPHTRETSMLCLAIAEHFADTNVEMVIAPAIGGAILTQWTAYHLSEITEHEVLAVYAEKASEGPDSPNTGALPSSREVSFEFTRGYEKLIPNRRVLVVEDVLTTGGSAQKVIELTRATGGKVIGLAALCNRGAITPKDVANPPSLFSLVNVEFDAWEAKDCPLCQEGTPINTSVGKGAEFLTRQRQ